MQNKKEDLVQLQLGDIVIPKTSAGLWLANVPTLGSPEEKTEPVCVFKGKGTVIDVYDCTLYYPEEVDDSKDPDDEDYVICPAMAIQNYRNVLISCDEGEGWAGDGAVILDSPKG